MINTRTNLAWLLSLGLAGACFGWQDTGMEGGKGGQTAQAATPAPARLDALDAFLSHVPSDALFVAFTEDVDALMGNPLIDQLCLANPAFKSYMQMPRRLLGGRFGLSISGMVMNPASWQVTVLMDAKPGAQPTLDRVESTLNAICRMPMAADAEDCLQVTRDGDQLKVRVMAMMPPLHMVEKEGVVFASNDQQAVQSWLAGEHASDTFAGSGRLAQLKKGMPTGIGGFVYLDVRPLVALVPIMGEPSLTETVNRLDLNQITYAALLITGNRHADAQQNAPAADDREADHKPTRRTSEADRAARPRTAPPARKEQVASSPDQFRLAVGLQELRPGFLRMLASRPGKAELLRYFPADTDVLIDGSADSCVDTVDDISAILTDFAPEVVDEYETELKELNRELGFDFQAEFLANVGSEWAFGGKARADGLADPLFALRIKDRALFKKHLRRLEAIYDLQSSTSSYREVTLYHAVHKPKGFSYMLTKDALLVSSEPQALTYAIDAWTDGDNLSTSRSYGAIRRQLPGDSSKLVYFDLGGVLARATTPREREPFAFAEALIRERAALGLAIRPYDDMIAIDVASSSASGKASAASAFAMLVAGSLEASREQAKRVQSMSNMRSIVTACAVYANDHDKQWPETLEVLARSGVWGDEATMRKLLKNPYEDGTGRASYYLYRPLPDPNRKQLADFVVLCEPDLRDRGASCAFADGHVERVMSPRAEQLIAAIRNAR